MEPHHPMQSLKIFFRMVIQFIRSLPQSFRYASQVRKQRSSRSGFEFERLDRIRRPAEYRGKTL